MKLEYPGSGAYVIVRDHDKIRLNAAESSLFGHLCLASAEDCVNACRTATDLWTLRLADDYLTENRVDAKTRLRAIRRRIAVLTKPALIDFDAATESETEVAATQNETTDV